MVVDDRREHQLVGAGAGLQLGQPAPDRRRDADDLVDLSLANRLALQVGVRVGGRFVRGWAAGRARPGAA